MRALTSFVAWGLAIAVGVAPAAEPSTNSIGMQLVEIPAVNS